uniref:Trafficking protein particle complex subunit 10-like n=1 Tax=Phallusia mammillata TaxID=59560 RepID=A0A6F9DW05_9ASCI|nr:trafficking protein particle complex subunit 10-like [Phallusia mammillata]
MENKATLTYSFSESGDENLFLTLSTRLCDTLSNQTVEWRQTYGRASHQFQLKVKILPLATALLERTDLVTRPYFHIFWTDCNDLDQYRSTIRTEISSWVNTLKNYKDTEWMIVVVAGDILSRLTKAKLPIPRMSIPDKVKSDFCSKNPERLHILHDPTKETTKSTESWTALGLKVANQTVRCMEVVVSKYEERVRAERERRNEKSWDFCSYLILQEELAFMYEMLGMFSPALVQYDELDAMFTQYVLNANAGDIAHWLSRFSEPIKHWHSMLLWKRIDGDARRSILEGQASIIDIRNYLFTRLCHLLFETGKLTEITQRMHIFLHSLSTEIAILEITVPSGAIDCWVFMCCLELVGALCRKSQLQNETDNTATDNPCFDMSNEQLVLENASLWNIARLKLYSLGELCGLMPGIVTTSAHLQIVVDLLAGMGEGEERGDVATSPALVLREALSSKNNFQKQYFELSELAMGTFKHMGHFRAVRCIGNDMAEFYLKLGEPAQAENYLIDTVRMYEADGWPLLLAKANKMLARCYKKMINIRKYLRLCYSLMCDEMISQEERIFYCDEFKSLSTDLGDDTLALNIHPLASVTSIQFIPAETSLRLNSNHHIVVTINSNAPKPMTFQSLQISLDHLGPDDGIEPHNIPDVISLSSFFSRTSEDEADVKSLLSRNFSHNSSAYNSLQPFRRHKRYASTTSSREFMSNQPAEINDEGRIDLIHFQHSKPSKFPASISLHAQRDLQDGALAWAGITCRHANDLLRRQDSSQSQVDKHRSTMSVTMETYECCLTTRQVTLNPGMNRVKLNAKTDLEGYFTLQQLRMSLHKTSFVLPRIYPLVSYQVSYLQPKVFMDHNEDLISGIVQHINIAVNKGDYVNPDQESNSTLSFKTPPSVRLLCVTKCSVATPDEDVSEIEKPSLVTSSDETSINLPSTSLHATVLLKIACLCLTTPYVQKLDVRKRHRRTHSAPPATFSRSPKSAQTQTHC